MITHDLGVIAETWQQVAVFMPARWWSRPAWTTSSTTTAHPYTSGLLRSVTSLGGEQGGLYHPGHRAHRAVLFRLPLPTGANTLHARCREAVPPLTEVALST